MPIGEVLRKAGVSDNFLYLTPKHGRRSDKLEALARELGWTIAELLGEKASPFDAQMHAQSVRLALRLVRRHPPPAGASAEAELVGKVSTVIYSWLTARAANGQPLLLGDDEAALSLITQVIQCFLDSRGGAGGAEK